MKILILLIKYSIISLVCLSFLQSCKSGKESTLPFFNSQEYTPEWIAENDENYDQIHTIGRFEFTDQKNNIVKNGTLRDYIYVADFFFTTCPSICPKMTEHMLEIQDTFINDNDIKLLSHSVMPWKDSVLVLDAYAKLKGVNYPKWHLVTGDENEIYALARKSYFADEDFGFTANEEDFLHTDKFILVDKLGRIRGIYSGIVEEDIQRIIEDIKILKQEN